MSKENNSKYFLKYPHYMPWSRRLYVLTRGTVINKGEESLVVKQVTRSPIQGEPPRIVLRSMEDQQTQ